MNLGFKFLTKACFKISSIVSRNESCEVPWILGDKGDSISTRGNCDKCDVTTN